MFNVQKSLTSWIVSSVVGVADVKPDDIEGALVLGNAKLRNVRLKRSRINAQLPPAVHERVECVGAALDDLDVSVPWLSLSAQPIEVDASGLRILFRPNEEPGAATAISEETRSDRHDDLSRAFAYWAALRAPGPDASISSAASSSGESFASCMSSSGRSNKQAGPRPSARSELSDEGTADDFASCCGDEDLMPDEDPDHSGSNRSSATPSVATPDGEERAEAPAAITTVAAHGVEAAPPVAAQGDNDTVDESAEPQQEGWWSWVASAVSSVVPPKISSRCVSVMVRDASITLEVGASAIVLHIDSFSFSFDPNEPAKTKHVVVEGLSVRVRRGDTVTDLMPPMACTVDAAVNDDGRIDIAAAFTSTLELCLSSDAQAAVGALADELRREWAMPFYIRQLEPVRLSRDRWAFAAAAVRAGVRERRKRWNFSTSYLTQRREHREDLVRLLVGGLGSRLEEQTAEDILAVEDAIGFRDVVYALRLTARHRCFDETTAAGVSGLGSFAETVAVQKAVDISAAVTATCVCVRWGGGFVVSLETAAVNVAAASSTSRTRASASIGAIKTELEGFEMAIDPSPQTHNAFALAVTSDKPSERTSKKQPTTLSRRQRQPLQLHTSSTTSISVLLGPVFAEARGVASFGPIAASVAELTDCATSVAQCLSVPVGRASTPHLSTAESASPTTAASTLLLDLTGEDARVILGVMDITVRSVRVVTPTDAPEITVSTRQMRWLVDGWLFAKAATFNYTTSGLEKGATQRHVLSATNASVFDDGIVADIHSFDVGSTTYSTTLTIAGCIALINVPHLVDHGADIGNAISAIGNMVSGSGKSSGPSKVLLVPMTVSTGPGRLLESRLSLRAASSVPRNAAAMIIDKRGSIVAVRSRQDRKACFCVASGIGGLKFQFGMAHTDEYEGGEFALEVMPCFGRAANGCGDEMCALSGMSATVCANTTSFPKTLANFHAQRLRINVGLPDMLRTDGGSHSSSLPRAGDGLDSRSLLAVEASVVDVVTTSMAGIGSSDAVPGAPAQNDVAVTVAGGARLFVADVCDPEWRRSMQGSMGALHALTADGHVAKVLSRSRHPMPHELCRSVSGATFELRGEGRGGIEVGDNCGVVVVEDCTIHAPSACAPATTPVEEARQFALDPVLVTVGDGTCLVLRRCDIVGLGDFPSSRMALDRFVKARGSGTLIVDSVRYVSSSSQPADSCPFDDSAAVPPDCTSRDPKNTISVRVARLAADVAIAHSRCLHVRSTNLAFHATTVTKDDMGGCRSGNPRGTSLEASVASIIVVEARGQASFVSDRQASPCSDQTAQREAAVTPPDAVASSYEGLWKNSPPSDALSPVGAIANKSLPPRNKSVDSCFGTPLNRSLGPMTHGTPTRRKVASVSIMDLTDVPATAHRTPSALGAESVESAPAGAIPSDSVSIVDAASMEAVVQLTRVRRGAPIDAVDVTVESSAASLTLPSDLLRRVGTTVSAMADLLKSDGAGQDESRATPPPRGCEPTPSQQLQSVAPTRRSTRVSPWSLLFVQESAPRSVAIRLHGRGETLLRLRASSATPFLTLSAKRGVFEINVVDDDRDHTAKILCKTDVAMAVFNPRTLVEKRVASRTSLSATMEHRWEIERASSAADVVSTSNSAAPSTMASVQSSANTSPARGRSWWNIFSRGSKSAPAAASSSTGTGDKPAEEPDSGTHITFNVGPLLRVDLDPDVVVMLRLGARGLLTSLDDSRDTPGLTLQDRTTLGFSVRLSKSDSRRATETTTTSRRTSGRSRGHVCQAGQTVHEPLACLSGAPLRITLIGGPGKREARTLVFATRGTSADPAVAPTRFSETDTVGWLPPVGSAGNVFFTQVMHFGPGVSAIGRLIITERGQHFTLLSPLLVVNMLPFPIAFGRDANLPDTDSADSLHDGPAVEAAAEPLVPLLTTTTAFETTTMTGSAGTCTTVGSRVTGCVGFDALDDATLMIRRMSNTGGQTMATGTLPVSGRCVAQAAALNVPVTKTKRFQLQLSPLSAFESRDLFAFVDVTFNAVLGAPEITIRPMLTVVNRIALAVRLRVQQSVLPLLHPDWAPAPADGTVKGLLEQSTVDGGGSALSLEAPGPEREDVIVAEEVLQPGASFELMHHRPTHTLSLRVAAVGTQHAALYDVPLSLHQPPFEVQGRPAAKADDLTQVRLVDVRSTKGASRGKLRLNFAVTANRIVALHCTAAGLFNRTECDMAVDVGEASAEQQRAQPALEAFNATSHAEAPLTLASSGAEIRVKRRTLAVPMHCTHPEKEAWSPQLSNACAPSKAMALGVEYICPRGKAKSSVTDCFRAAVGPRGGTFDLIPAWTFATADVSTMVSKERISSDLAFCVQLAADPDPKTVVDHVIVANGTQSSTSTYSMSAKGVPRNFARFQELPTSVSATSPDEWSEWMHIEAFIPGTGAASWASNATGVLVHMSRPLASATMTVRITRRSAAPITLYNTTSDEVEIVSPSTAADPIASAPIRSRQVCPPVSSVVHVPRVTAAGAPPASVGLRVGGRELTLRLDAARPASAPPQIQPVSAAVSLAMTTIKSAEHGLAYIIVLLRNDADETLQPADPHEEAGAAAATVAVRAALGASRATHLQRVSLSCTLGAVDCVLEGLAEVALSACTVNYNHRARMDNRLSAKIDDVRVRDLTLVARQPEMILDPVTAGILVKGIDVTRGIGQTVLHARTAGFEMTPARVHFAEDVLANATTFFGADFSRPPRAFEMHSALPPPKLGVVQRKTAQSALPPSVAVRLGECTIGEVSLVLTWVRSESPSRQLLRSIPALLLFRSMRDGHLTLSAFKTSRVDSTVGAFAWRLAEHYALALPGQLLTILGSNEHIAESTYMLGDISLASAATTALLPTSRTLQGVTALFTTLASLQQQQQQPQQRRGTGKAPTNVAKPRVAAPASALPTPSASSPQTMTMPDAEATSATLGRTAQRSPLPLPAIAPVAPPTAWVCESVVPVADRLDVDDLAAGDAEDAAECMLSIIATHGIAGVALLVSLEQALTWLPAALVARHWGALRSAAQLRRHFPALVPMHALPQCSDADGILLFELDADNAAGQFRTALQALDKEHAVKGGSLAFAPPFAASERIASSLTSVIEGALARLQAVKSPVVQDHARSFESAGTRSTLAGAAELD